MHPFTRIFDRLTRRAAVETLRSDSRRLWRVHHIECEVSNYDRSLRIGVQFDTGRARFQVNEVMPVSAMEGWDVGSVYFGPEVNVVIQELFEAHLNLHRAARIRVETPEYYLRTPVPQPISFEPLGIAPSAISVAMEFRRERAQDSLEYAEMHLDAIQCHLSSVLSQRTSIDRYYRNERTRQVWGRMAHNLEWTDSVEQGWNRRLATPRWSEEAIAKGWELLRANLTKDQLSEFERHRFFHVIGGDTGNIYRITEGTQQNVFRVRYDGTVSGGHCFLPEGDLVIGDVMLAQKAALELDERAALKISNSFMPPTQLATMPTSAERIAQLCELSRAAKARNKS